jgi:hypothetical protein
LTKDGDGKEIYKEIPDSKITVVDAQFQYTNEPPTSKKGLFSMRAFGGAGYNFDSPGLVVGLEVLNYKRFGLNSSTYFDMKTIKNTQQRIGIDYNVKLFGQELNVAPGISVGTYFNDLFKKVSMSVDLIFFINN